MTSATVGARRPSQIDKTDGGGDWALTPEVVAEIEKLLAQRSRAVAVASEGKKE